MKIAIDISQIIYGTGVSVYTKELVSHLQRIDKENEYILFGGSLRRRRELSEYTNKILPISPSIADFVWNKLHILNVERFIGKIDVLHSSDWAQPPTNAYKVTTVHDLAPIKFPQSTPKKIVDVHKRRLYWVLKEVNKIIVPTNSVKGDLIEIGANPQRIKVINEGIGDIFRKQQKESVEITKRKLGIRNDYILAIGMNPRKNTQRIIEAFEKSKKKFKLVIVGEGKEQIDSARGVIYTGFVNNYDLVNLYSGAKALVYPSLYEGFGLPILQAFACECPVVTSNSGAMKEIAGEGAVLVDPLDTNSIADGINKAISNPKTLGKKGLKRAKEFSWEKCARETLEVYKSSNQAN